MTPFELERALDERLRRLRSPAAPTTLGPRVMAAAARRAQARWYERPWNTWPVASRVGSAVAVVVLAIAWWFGAATESVAGLMAPAGATLRAAGLVWRALFQPVAPYAFAVVFVMGVACMGTVAALTRVVSREVSA